MTLEQHEGGDTGIIMRVNMRMRRKGDWKAREPTKSLMVAIRIERDVVFASENSLDA
jgi:hypothetical protein